MFRCREGPSTAWPDLRAQQNDRSQGPCKTHGAVGTCGTAEREARIPTPLVNAMSDLREDLRRAVDEGRLLAVSCANILQFLSRGNNPVYRTAIEELFENNHWTELNDRFFKTLAFCTGGLRGRTIGKVVTRAEAGSQSGGSCPEFPCVGTNAMNFYNVSRATQGLVNYAREYLSKNNPGAKPSIGIAHDTRHF